MAELRRPWWSDPSTWAPQRPPTIWTREMDWVALSVIDHGLPDGATMASMARATGVTVAEFQRRMTTLEVVCLLSRPGSHRL